MPKKDFGKQPFYVKIGNVRVIEKMGEAYQHRLKEKTGRNEPNNEKESPGD